MDILDAGPIDVIAFCHSCGRTSPARISDPAATDQACKHCDSPLLTFSTGEQAPRWDPEIGSANEAHRQMGPFRSDWSDAGHFGSAPDRIRDLFIAASANDDPTESK